MWSMDTMNQCMRMCTIVIVSIQLNKVGKSGKRTREHKNERPTHERAHERTNERTHTHTRICGGKLTFIFNSICTHLTAFDWRLDLDQTRTHTNRHLFLFSVFAKGQLTCWLVNLSLCFHVFIHIAFIARETLGSEQLFQLFLLHIRVRVASLNIPKRPKYRIVVLHISQLNEMNHPTISRYRIAFNFTLHKMVDFLFIFCLI